VVPRDALAGAAGEVTAVGARCCAIATAAPPIAQGSLSLAPDGRVYLALRRPWRDGSRALLFDPLDFLGRLAALTPKPRVNLLLYHGVFGPHAARRRAAVAQAREAAEGPAESGSAAGSAAGRSSPRVASGQATVAVPAGAAVPGERSLVRWADLLRRVFEIDVLHCARCGGRLRFVAAIDDPEVVRRILGHLGLPTSIAPPLPARSPPAPCLLPAHRREQHQAEALREPSSYAPMRDLFSSTQHPSLSPQLAQQLKRATSFSNATAASFTPSPSVR
jgi:hypothetical protein